MEMVEGQEVSNGRETILIGTKTTLAEKSFPGTMIVKVNTALVTGIEGKTGRGIEHPPHPTHRREQAMIQTAVI